MWRFASRPAVSRLLPIELVRGQDWPPDDSKELAGRPHQQRPDVQATILNVDDNEIGRYARSRFLNRAGFTVIEAATGNDALRMTREEIGSLRADLTLATGIQRGAVAELKKGNRDAA